MTKTGLRLNVVLVICALLSVFAVAAIAKHCYQQREAYETIKDFSGLFIAVAAAYLAYCFQRRQAFLSALRELWRDMIDAKAALFEYTHNPTPDAQAFGRTHLALSRTIDTVRGVYTNVGESRRSIGLYPFQPLHDMRSALERLGYVDVTDAKRLEARSSMLRAWNALRWAFLKEFSRPRPLHSITKSGAADPRR